MTDLVGDLIERALRTSMVNHADAHRKWLDVQYRFGAIAGVASLTTFASSTRMDMLLRQLEGELLVRVAKPQTGAEFIDDFVISLSEAWVMRIYELTRAARERAKNRSEEFPLKLQELLRLLELVRMPIDKGEIAKANFYKGPPIIMTHADGSDPREYRNDGSYIIPRGICGQTGAVMWWPLDLRANETIEVCRRDLSEMLLAAFD